MSGLLSAQRVRVLTAALPGLVLLLAGCDQSGKYPQDLAYPLRSDLIVSSTPTTEVFEPDRPGDLDRHFAGIKGLDGAKTLDPNEIAAADRSALGKALNTIFGRPAAPLVKVQDEKVAETARQLHLTEQSLENGSILYRRHCLHCHGVSGDGRGPTGPWLNPHPRDYRSGLFKFLSTTTAGEVKDPDDPKGKKTVPLERKPRRADLLRTLRVGIEGTSMPAFSMLGEQELEDLVSYVIHLSLRGEAEMKTLKDIKNKEFDSTIEARVASTVDELIQSWSLSNQNANQPPRYPYKDSDREESIVRGYRLFLNEQKGNCIGCHTDFGRQVNFRYDDWGTLVRPANLTAGIYRGGRRPIDLYWRISGGIRGTPMPAVKLESREYWDMVNFVQAVPYPAMLPDEVRSGVYPEMEKTAGKAQARR